MVTIRELLKKTREGAKKKTKDAYNKVLDADVNNLGKKLHKNSFKVWLVFFLCWVIVAIYLDSKSYTMSINQKGVHHIPTNILANAQSFVANLSSYNDWKIEFEKSKGVEVEFIITDENNDKVKIKDTCYRNNKFWYESVFEDVTDDASYANTLRHFRKQLTDIDFVNEMIGGQCLKWFESLVEMKRSKHNALISLRDLSKSIFIIFIIPLLVYPIYRFIVKNTYIKR